MLQVTGLHESIAQCLTANVNEKWRRCVGAMIFWRLLITSKVRRSKSKKRYAHPVRYIGTLLFYASCKHSFLREFNSCC